MGVTMAEPEFMFKVEDTFDISGRGIVAQGLRHTQLGSLGKGDRVELRRPDGSVLRMEVAGVERHTSFIGTPPPIEERRFGVLLSPVVASADVPLGAEVWLVERAPINAVERTASQPSGRVGLFRQLWRLARGRSL